MQTHSETYEQGKQYYIKGRCDVLKMIIEQLEKGPDEIDTKTLLEILKIQLKNEQ